MQKSGISLIKILRKLSNTEMRELGEFVRSPFFNKNEIVIKLLNYLKKYHPDFDDEKLDKKYIFKKLYGKRKYNDGCMRIILHNLVKLAEEYLTFINNNKDSIKKGLSLLEELNNRQLSKQFKKKFSTVEKSLSKVDLQDSEYYFRKYKLESLRFFFQIINRHQTSNENIFNFERIKDEFRYLTAFYMINALRVYRFLLYENEYVKKINTDLDFSEQLIDYLAKNESVFSKLPHIKLLHNEILLIKNKCDETYLQLKEIFINSRYELSHNERFSLHTILQEYCRTRQNGVNDNNIRERFELFKVALEQGLYAVEGDSYMDDKFFEIILSIAVSLKEFDWAEKFINLHKNLLSPKNSHTVVNISLARLAAANGDHKRSLSLLNQIEPIHDVQYKLVVKGMLLVAYYELNMFDQANYLLDSYRHFITNNKKSFMDIDIQRNENFRKLLCKLIKIREHPKMEEIKRLLDDLGKTELVSNKKWIAKKITDIHNQVKSAS